MPTRFTAKKCAWQWNSRVRWRKFGAFLSDMLCTASRHTFCLLMVRNEREDCPTEMGTVEKEWNNNKFRIIRIPRWAMMGLLCFILVFVFVTNNLPSTNPLGTTDRYVKKNYLAPTKSKSIVWNVMMPVQWNILKNDLVAWNVNESCVYIPTIRSINTSTNANKKKPLTEFGFVACNGR